MATLRKESKVAPAANAAPVPAQTALAKQQPQTLAIGSDIFAQSAGQGFGNMTDKDTSIPFLNILQPLSPEVSRTDAKSIDGAEAGMVVNNVSRELYDCRQGVKGSEAITIIPCSFRKSWVEWRDRASGGGFVKSHETDDILRSTTKDAKGQDRLANGNLVVTTMYYCILMQEPNGSFTPAVLPMKSTQLKKARKWNSEMRTERLQRADGSSYAAPIFAFKYRVSTVEESNAQGKWWGWKIEKDEQVQSSDVELVQSALSLNEQSSAILASPLVQTGVGDVADDISDISNRPY